MFVGKSAWLHGFSPGDTRPRIVPERLYPPYLLFSLNGNSVQLLFVENHVDPQRKFQVNQFGCEYKAKCYQYSLPYPYKYEVFDSTNI